MLHSATLLLLLPVLIARGGYGAEEKKPLVHGHRGSRGTHPENSIPAFEEALKAGAQVLELDLQLTADDVPVLWHDDHILNEYCRLPVDGKPIRIRSLKAFEIAKLECGMLPHPRFPLQKKMVTHIVTLGDFLDWIGKQAKASTVEFNMETKMTDPSLDPNSFVQTIVTILRQKNVVARTILQSFDFRTLQVARQLEPNLRLSALFEGKSGGDICTVAKNLGAKYVSPQWGTFDANTVKRCHGLNIQVVPWTLNSVDEWKGATALGVDAIITDFPRNLIQFLSKT